MRRSGVLMHITSLPSRGGIGTLGKAAYDFIDFVKASGMSLWQMLPIGPTGYAESPYQSASTFAGNPLVIDFDLLEKEDILPAGSYEPLPMPEKIDFEAVKAQKYDLLRKAFAYSGEKLAPELEVFRKAHAWVEDFALFYAVKTHFGGVSWMEWPDNAIRLRKPEAVASYREALAGEIEYYIFEQYLFRRQWDALRAYAKANRIRLMGDMPIYVAEDSADVWMNPDLFELDEDCKPIRIAGVPPDYFQADGQRWGNPLYVWEKHAETKFDWWIRRLSALGELFDILRIDHFIGFANYYAIPATELTARNGKYELGPGYKLFARIKKALPDLEIIAEDLGVVSKRVKKLLARCGYPGMKVLQFAFDGDETSPDLPANYTTNCVVYTGTHDNNTTLGWWDGAAESVKTFAREQLGMPEDSDEILPYILDAAFGSVADTVVVPMQDWLGLDGEARMNYPGTVGGNWLWRMMPADLAPVAARIRHLNRSYRRGDLPEPIDAEALRARANEYLFPRFRTTWEQASPYQLQDVLAGEIMRVIARQWDDDRQYHMSRRHALYLSAEYLTGRLLHNNLYALGLLEPLRKAGVDLNAMEDIEDAALGNGGLGRLAACFLDSAATHDIPLDGYGLRYRYGLFKQSFADCEQHEEGDDWTRFGDPWSVRREDEAVIVEMAGLTVRAVPYDMPVIGYGRRSIGTLRLWQCESPKPFDFDTFNDMNYLEAARDQVEAEALTMLLYPNDNSDAGRLMRLRQQYVLCSASLQDMLRAYRAQGGELSDFAAKHAVQLNDTHPTMAIPELIRLLMQENFSFAAAFDIAQKTFRYTNHTVMGEALEKWDIKLMKQLNPVLVIIIRKIQQKLARKLKREGITETDRLDIVGGGQVRMANLAVYGSSYVNGVAEIHTQILKDTTFKEWYALFPERFSNKTNGITQRRWLGLCDPGLTALLTEKIGEGFLTDLDQLEQLRPMIDDDLAGRFIEVKRENKRRLAKIILEREGIEIPEDFIFDVQIKRLHEYKRQLLNAFSILDIYYHLKDGTLTDFPKTAFIFGAKSAPAYRRAKAVIRYINRIAELVNADPDTNDRLRVVFVQNYNCSYAEYIIPAADISEQISPAGTEASGTGNMKLMLNGAVTLGTRDGANVEIFEQAGEENNYPFGATVEEIEALGEDYDPVAIYEADDDIRRVVDSLADGSFEPKDAPLVEGTLAELKQSILEGASWHKPDYRYLLLDFKAYQQARLQALRDAEDAIPFAKKCLYNIAAAGKFSSDRTIQQYWNELWK